MSKGTTRGVPIEYSQVEAAYTKMRQGGKASGVDKESWELFDKNKEDNLYVIWNRMSAGSYHPQAVREVEIPKKDGKTRKLGIPTLKDRIAQEVVKAYMEERIDKLFHEDSYGYRPLKSAKQAIEKTREYCYKYDWVIDMDIANFFDEIDHELMLKAVEHVMPEKWVKMYVERWLKMPIQKADGSLIAKEGKGTPQGGVISPLLANLYLHYTLDKWLPRKYPATSFVRYADDMVIHCRTKAEAEEILEAVRQRLIEVKLQIKEAKTKIVYCKDYRRKEKHESVKFEFLGFSFQPRARISKQVEGTTFLAFTAEISQSNQKRIRETIARAAIWKKTTLTIQEIASYLNPQIRGWINYYGIFSRAKLRRVMLKIDQRIIGWIKKKYKVRYRKALARHRMIKTENPNLFYHWGHV
jgi:group II intron reverse transcriptase/maturase